MEVIKTKIDGLLLIKLKSFKDERGFFVERFSKNAFKDIGILNDFVQDNHSMSYPNVIRGLHTQEGQSKLIGIICGKIIDIAVDLRASSPTFGQYESFLLSDTEDPCLVYIPEGFAHGFANIGDSPAHLYYKVNSFYNPNLESGIKWDDPELGIKWNIKNPIVSERDQNLQTFSNYSKNK